MYETNGKAVCNTYLCPESYIKPALPTNQHVLWPPTRLKPDADPISFLVENFSFSPLTLNFKSRNAIPGQLHT